MLILKAHTAHKALLDFSHPEMGKSVFEWRREEEGRNAGCKI